MTGCHVSLSKKAKEVSPFGYLKMNCFAYSSVDTRMYSAAHWRRASLLFFHKNHLSFQKWFHFTEDRWYNSVVLVLLSGLSRYGSCPPSVLVTPGAVFYF